MKHKSILQIVLVVLFVCASGSAKAPHLPINGNEKKSGAKAAQIEFAQIVLNGRKLTGPNSSAQRRGGRVMIPVVALARGLGDLVTIDSAQRTISLRLQTGASTDFDSRLGQVRENGSPILKVSNSAELIFPPNTEELLLPVEIVAALFDVSIRFDDNQKLVVVTRGFASSENTQTKISRGPVEIFRVDYDYNLNRYVRGASHSLALSGVGRLGDGRFNFSSNSSRTGSKGFSIRNTSFALERPNGHRFLGGDFGVGSNLQFLSSNVRGGSASAPVGNMMVTAFAGRSHSGIIVPIDEQNLTPQKGYSYDTNIFGVVASSNYLFGRKMTALNYSAGTTRFSSSHRTGETIAASLNYDIAKLRLQSDFGFGRFNGLSTENRRINGTAGAVDLAGTYQVSDALSVQARYTNIGKNFLSSQSGVREPYTVKAAGLTWSPLKWFSTSFNASTAQNKVSTTGDSRFVTGAFSITPTSGLPRIYASHTQSRTSLIKSASFTMLNASREFQKLRLFLNATRVKNIGPASTNVQLGANYALNDRNSLEFSQGVTNQKALNGQFDWRTSNLMNGRLSFTAGAGYSYSQSSKLSTYERVTASLNLPGQTSLQVNYYQTSSGPAVLVSLKGSLFKKRESNALFDSPISEMNSYGKISGRVYQDVDLNGQFDSSIDKPQADVKIRVDGNRYVVSDENGLYKFESVSAGDHKVYVDLLSVRADLTLLSSTSLSTDLRAGHDSTYDFRLVRTGRISGRVWLDSNENGQFDEGEVPLADVRVVTASGRDTLTDSEGYFTIGDLTPGEHVFFLDEKTLPEKTQAGVKPLAIQAFPGRETKDIALPVIATPAEVKHFPAKPKS